MTDKMTAEQALTLLHNSAIPSMTNDAVLAEIEQAAEIVRKGLGAVNVPEGWKLIPIQQYQALTAPRVPEGWRTAREGKDRPSIGEKYLIRIGPDHVMQHEVFEFDQGDDGNGGGEFFWGRDDIDECPAFDSEKDEWLPLSAMLTAAPAPADSELARLRARVNELEGYNVGLATESHAFRDALNKIQAIAGGYVSEICRQALAGGSDE